MCPQSQPGRPAKKYSQAERLLKLYQKFINGARITQRELAEEAEVTKRSIQRDLDALMVTGVPLEAEILDNGEHAFYLPEAARGKAVYLTPTQRFTLKLGRRLFDFLDGTILAEELGDIYKKLNTGLTPNERKRFKEFDRKYYTLGEAPKDYSKHQDVVDSVVTALFYNFKLSVTYQKVGGEPETYLFHPYTLVTYRRGLYLLGYSEKSKALRSLAVERMIDADYLRKDKFSYPKNYSPEKHFDGSFGIFAQGKTRHRVELLFDEGSGPMIENRKWHKTQKIKRRKNGKYDFSMTVRDLSEVVFWVLSFGNHVKVLGPAGLKKQVRAHAQGILGKAKR